MGLLFHSTKFSCCECEKHFPRSVLITIHDQQYCTQCSHNVFKETTYCVTCGIETNATRLCKSCNKITITDMKHCDGCGEDYPSSHLQYIELYNGLFCSRCGDLEGDDEHYV